MQKLIIIVLLIINVIIVKVQNLPLCEISETITIHSETITIHDDENGQMWLYQPEFEPILLSEMQGNVSWSPNRDYIYYQINEDGIYELFSITEQNRESLPVRPHIWLDDYTILAITQPSRDETTVDNPSRMHLYDVETGQQTLLANYTDATILHAQKSPSTRYIIYTLESNSFEIDGLIYHNIQTHLYDTETKNDSILIEDDLHDMNWRYFSWYVQIIWSPDESQFVLDAHIGGTIYSIVELYDTPSITKQLLPIRTRFGSGSITWLPDGSGFYYPNSDFDGVPAAIALYDIASDRTLWEFPVENSNNSQLIRMSVDGLLWVWESTRIGADFYPIALYLIDSTGTVQYTFRPDTIDYMAEVYVSPDGSFVAYTNNIYDVTSFIFIERVETGESVILDGNYERFRISWTADSRYLRYQDEETIYLYDTQTNTSCYLGDT